MTRWQLVANAARVALLGSRTQRAFLAGVLAHDTDLTHTDGSWDDVEAFERGRHAARAPLGPL